MPVSKKRKKTKSKFDKVTVEYYEDNTKLFPASKQKQWLEYESLVLDMLEKKAYEVIDNKFEIEFNGFTDILEKMLFCIVNEMEILSIESNWKNSYEILNAIYKGDQAIKHFKVIESTMNEMSQSFPELTDFINRHLKDLSDRCVSGDNRLTMKRYHDTNKKVNQMSKRLGSTYMYVVSLVNEQIIDYLQLMHDMRYKFQLEAFKGRVFKNFGVINTEEDLNLFKISINSTDDFEFLGFEGQIESNEILEKKCIIVKEKLFNHRELNNLAFKKGFEIVRQKGDHGILKHKKTNKTVVIPQGRMLGKGLSMKIQKDLVLNSF